MTNKPSPVSRSVYQKLAEENKRLKADIYSIVTLSKGWMEVHDRWKKKFDADKAFWAERREELLKR